MKNIIFIFADGCNDCKRMEKILLDQVYKRKDYIVKSYNSEDPKAIDIAIDNSIFDVPGCNINGKSVYGKDFKEEDILKLFQ